jgi:M6 family metalloprotease-like protein
MIKRFLLLFLLAISLFQTGFSSPAYPKRVKFTQPDGSTITITLKGDEHNKWAVTSDGYTLLSNSKGFFEYAINDNRGYLIPSGVVAKDIDKRTTEDKEILSKTKKGLFYSKEQLQMLKSIRAIKAKEAQKSFPTTGNRKLICILMGFKDKAFTKTQADFNNLFNQTNYTTNGATGSVKDYYLENSYNQFNLTVTVAGPYTASQNMSYYGANDSDGYDVKPDVLVTEAVTAADADVNFADFDNDNDGNVDGVYVIYAGYGEEAGAPTNTIWAHAWEIPAKTCDGKIITSYSCSSELSGTSGTTMTSIGVICHEFGHVLGAPDYYDTDYETGGQYEGTGEWDLMASGSWNNDGITPAHHNAYTKTMIYGWGVATTLTDGTSITIPSSKTNSSAFYRINTATTDEFYLIENRQQTGFDAYAPGHGLIIYHVSKDIVSHFDNNDINAKAPQLMYPVCASATTNPGSTATTYGNINSGGCPFPGSSNKTSFTDATTPSMKSWLGVATNKPITNISENTSTGIITFDFDGGNTGNPTNFSAIAKSESQIDLTWAKSENRDVIIAYSTSATFGSLVDGTTYTAGQSINGGGTVLYQGDATTFSHTNLNSNTAYYYKAWTRLTSTPTYSLGTVTQTKTACSGILTLPLTEDFNSGDISGCWSIIDNQGNGQVWQVGSISSGLSGTYIYLDSDGYGEDNTQNADLVTPAINTVGLTSVTISFKHYFKVETGETATFSYSLDGTNWIQIDQWTATTANPTNYKKILTEVANKPSVKFKWNYTGTWGWHWCIDDISITETSATDVVANFKADPTSVNINGSTTFTDLSNGTITSWAWDFGSGATPATATTAGPHTVTYSTTGNKTVTLTINGNVTETKTNYINVVDPNAPVVIVGWNFEDSNTTADEGIAANTAKTITTSATGTTSYSTGTGGTGTYALTNTGWDNGVDTKAWQTEFNTEGYNTITVSSKQKSSGTGPKEFKLQYKTTGTTWVDVPSGSLTLANDNYISGVLTNLALPADAANQPSVSLRWVMRSNLQVSSGNVASAGTSRIDDIVINGKKLDTPTQYTLTVSHVGNGTVSPTDGETNHNTGESITLTATPDQGWQFEKWEINGNTVTSATTQIT